MLPDLDSAAVYFLSDESRFVTGQVLSVDGGWSVSEGQIPGKASAAPASQAPNLASKLFSWWQKMK